MPGPAKAAVLRQNEAFAGTGTDACDSGNDGVGEAWRQPASGAGPPGLVTGSADSAFIRRRSPGPPPRTKCNSVSSQVAAYAKECHPSIRVLASPNFSFGATLCCP